MWDFKEISDLVLEYKLALSVTLAMLILIVRRWVIKGIRRRAKRKAQDKRPVVNAIKNITNLSLVFFLLAIWSAELQHLALSIAAFVVGIVLATREYIQCFTGFLYVTSTRVFRVGDWVEVGDVCGEVVESDWLSLTLQEVYLPTYDYTGKTLNIPNNQLFTKPVRNLNFLKRYATHTFTITRNQTVNVFQFIERLHERAKKHCLHFRDVAIRYNSMIEHRLDVTIPGPDPTIRVTTSELGDTEVTITIFCPTEEAIEIEQKITSDFMAYWYATKSKAALPEPADDEVHRVNGAS
ncbi:hypothetical protein HMF8227_00589 [Saliniradius amylolyticus]|uniref:Mechanosensitive ion channel MscS domain-containing protein n=1 Tax=Saliniradius amylolyticus TaxID=2183582 RepID=A0A2S2E0A6_9ALTE|nr:mechanosensitive ion channel family protein [Saliniradius amylolyticus]AWL11085.1 hypothetical protein HMF8227_00589 [Saliniradius amylolyticus]